MIFSPCKTPSGEHGNLIHHKTSQHVANPGDAHGHGEEEGCYTECEVCGHREDCDGSCKELLE